MSSKVAIGFNRIAGTGSTNIKINLDENANIVFIASHQEGFY
jgi:hypothetical protein